MEAVYKSMQENPKPEADHFRGKEAIDHIVEVQAEGVLASSEIHGAEMSGSRFAALDAARDLAVLLMLVASLPEICFPDWKGGLFALAASTSCAWIFWKMGRSTWLAWIRLERLHRVAKEEKYEIDVHRPSEREELRALYKAKGFQGRLLEDVVDVLMADGDRLLRVMLEEEMGFRLEEQEHPLIQGLGATVGATFTTVLGLIALHYGGVVAVFCTSLVILAASAFFSARLEKNRGLPALLWNVGIAVFIYILARSLSWYFI